jgi:glycosyltransferase involved in cell wall biosynthesis
MMTREHRLTLTVTPVQKKTVTEYAGAPIKASVIVPVRDGARHLRRTLPSLREALPADWEMIVVDDQSSDESTQVARLYADQVVLNLAGPSAPAARNAGAGVARGEFLIFVDADVRVTRTALLSLVRELEAPEIACTFGVYSEGRHLSTFGGRFKNIWVRYSYLRSPSRVRWMNTALAAVRREVFWSVGGFDGQDDWLEGGNDMDFGRVLDEKIGPVILLHGVDCDHLKELSLRGLLRNDFHRTRGFFRTAILSREIRRAPGQGYGNVSPSFMGGVIAAGAFPTATLLGLWWPAMLILAAAALAAHGLLSAGFYRYAMPRLGRGAWAVPIVLFCDHLACGAGLVTEVLHLTRQRLRGRRFPPVESARNIASRTDASTAARL